MSKGKVELLTHRLIDSVWTTMAIFNEVEKTVFILSYDRDNEQGYNLEKYCRHGCFVEKEGDGRICETLVVSSKDRYSFGFKGDEVERYKVENPQNIFSYSK
jgi:hypothetical protein|tara:strand:+ start:159 stop:464 length:306 start_codon:yes stop_codon:yes gene_type:complete